MRKRILSMLLILTLMLSLCLSVSALEVPDFDRTGSISIAMTHNGKPVPGGSLTLYRVAALEILPPDSVEDVTSGDFALTLFTCTYGGENRVVLRCDEAE